MTRTQRYLRLWLGVGLAVGIWVSPGPQVRADQFPCLSGQNDKVEQGFAIAPVPLNLDGKKEKERRLIGLGSYIVNAQGGCNDCHTSPSYAPGGSPFNGEPEQINTAGYLAGGAAFGPFVSRNITPCQEGKPAGLTFEEFQTVLHSGTDFKDALIPSLPVPTPLLQVMPWPVYGKMTTCDLRAVYEFLKAIPAHEGCIPPEN